MSPDMGVQWFGNTTKVRYDFKVGVITLVADGREMVIILLCNRNSIFKQDSNELDLGLKSFTIDIYEPILILLEVRWS